MITRIALYGLLIVCLAVPALAQSEALKIVAVVNNEIISEYDVLQRLRLVQATTGLRVNRDNLQQIRTQVVNQLVDEHLEAQEAKRDNVSVSEAEINERIDQIAHSTGRSRDEIMNFLTANNIETATFVNQVEAQLLWNKLVVRRYYAQSAVSQEDVTAALDRIKASAGKPEMLVSEIYLSIDKPSDIDAIFDHARRLVSEIRNGAAFDAIASQFSQSASAAVGGDLGWVPQGALPPELEAVLDKLEPGTVSDPVQLGSRVYIMGLRSRRLAQIGDPLDTRLAFLDVVFPAEKSAPLAILSTAHLKADNAAKAITSCADAPRIAAANSGVISGEMVQARAGDLRDQTMRKALMNIEVGRATEPVQLANGFHVLVLCGRQSPQGGIPSREEIESRLVETQLELKARRYLRDLQRDAAIDIK